MGTCMHTRGTETKCATHTSAELPNLFHHSSFDVDNSKNCRIIVNYFSSQNATRLAQLTRLFIMYVCARVGDVILRVCVQCGGVREWMDV